MSLVLVTGGAGFIGSYLAARLVGLGHEVHLADNFTRGARDKHLDTILSSGAARIIEVDLLAPGAENKIGNEYDVIYHLAAIVGVANVARAPYRVLTENVAMLQTAIAMARKQTALRRFSFASTSEVYAGSVQAGTLPFPTPEDVPLVLPDLASARTSYMLSKLYGEAMCLASALPTTIFRPHNVYGPRMGLSHVIPELLQRAHAARDGETLEVYSVDHRRTFCYVEDAVELIRLATDEVRGVGATVNIGNEAPEISIRELAEVVIRVVGKNLTISPLPATPGSPTRRAPSTERVWGLTDYLPSVPLAEGIARTYAWYRENVFEKNDEN